MGPGQAAQGGKICRRRIAVAVGTDRRRGALDRIHDLSFAADLSDEGIDVFRLLLDHEHGVAPGIVLKIVACQTFKAAIHIDLRE